MSKEVLLSPLIADYEECVARYDEIVNLIKNPDEFIIKIHENPTLIFSDNVVKHVISVFSDVCKLGNPVEADSAREVLLKAGVPAFIPLEARVRRSPIQYIRWFKQNPLMFVWAIENQKNRLRQYIKPTYRDTAKKTAVALKKDDILIAFKNIILGEELNQKEVDILTQGERSKDLTHISLSFLSFNPGDPSDPLPFESLKDLYYEIIKDYTPEQIEQIKKAMPIWADGALGYFEYIQIMHKY